MEPTPAPAESTQPTADEPPDAKPPARDPRQQLIRAARVAGFTLLVVGITAPRMKQRANAARMWAFRNRAALIARMDDPGALLRMSGALLVGAAAARRSQGTQAG